MSLTSNSLQDVAAGRLSLDTWRRVYVPLQVIARRVPLTATPWGGFGWQIDSVFVSQNIEPTAPQTATPVVSEPLRRTPNNESSQHAADGENHGGQNEILQGRGGEEPEPQNTLFRWQGLGVTLYRDSCERYWQALIGDEPKLYFLCGAEEQGKLPVRATVDYDEALAWAETDGSAVSCDIPPSLYQLMERFVVTHYRPVHFKKRRRTDWKAAEK